MNEEVSYLPGGPMHWCTLLIAPRDIPEGCRVRLLDTTTYYRLHRKFKITGDVTKVKIRKKDDNIVFLQNDKRIIIFGPGDGLLAVDFSDKFDLDKFFAAPANPPEKKPKLVSAGEPDDEEGETEADVEPRKGKKKKKKNRKPIFQEEETEPDDEDGNKPADKEAERWEEYEPEVLPPPKSQHPAPAKKPPKGNLDSEFTGDA